MPRKITWLFAVSDTYGHVAELEAGSFHDVCAMARRQLIDVRGEESDDCPDEDADEAITDALNELALLTPESGEWQFRFTKFDSLAAACGIGCIVIKPFYDRKKK